MDVKSVAWWVAYFIIAIWLQKIFPGFDAMIPGLLICLQDGRKRQTILFMIFVLLIQEGTSTLPFGTCIIWYSLVYACFYIGVFFFMDSNLFFIILVSLIISIGRFFMFLVMDSLQLLPLSPDEIISFCVKQAILTPILWWIVRISKYKVDENAYR